MSLLVLLALGCGVIVVMYLTYCECDENDTDENDLEREQFLNIDNMKYVTIDVGGVERRFVAYKNARRGMKVYSISTISHRSVVTKYKNSVDSSHVTFCAYPLKMARKSHTIQSHIKSGAMTLIQFGVEEVAADIVIDTFTDDVTLANADECAIVICVPSDIE